MVFDPTHNPYIEKCKAYKDWLVDEAEADKHKGLWRKVLKREKLTVEIGPGNGWFLVDYLKAHSEEGYVAIEKQYKRSVKCAEKLKAHNMINAKIIRGRGELLRDYFNACEVDKVIINFPTPWVKDRHRKHILFSEIFCEELSHILNKGGKLLLKSDHAQYISVASDILSKYKFVVETNKVGDEIPFLVNQTGYEKRWIEEGRDIFSIHAIKN